MKHTYEGSWDKSSPVLDTCNPGRMIYVTHNLPPQPVEAGQEVVFTYDVRFVVSRRGRGRSLGLPAQSQEGNVWRGGRRSSSPTTSAML